MNFASNFMGRFTRPKETKNLNTILCVFLFVFKTSVNLIILSDKFSSALPRETSIFNAANILLQKVTT